MIEYAEDVILCNMGLLFVFFIKQLICKKFAISTRVGKSIKKVLE